MASNYQSNNLNYKNLLIVYFIDIVIIIVLGLASRKYSDFLHPFLADHSGDALWAMMVYFGFRIFLIRKGIILSILLSFIFSFGIELSQLYQADWINHIRGTLLGALVLGKGFLFVDIFRYSFGIIIGACIDTLALKKVYR